jgi:hypothetical protein
VPIDDPWTVGQDNASVLDRAGDGEHRRLDGHRSTLTLEKGTNDVSEVSEVGDREIPDRTQDAIRQQPESSIGGADIAQQNPLLMQLHRMIQGHTSLRPTRPPLRDHANGPGRKVQRRPELFVAVDVKRVAVQQGPSLRDPQASKA